MKSLFLHLILLGRPVFLGRRYGFWQQMCAQCKVFAMVWERPNVKPAVLAGERSPRGQQAAIVSSGMDHRPDSWLHHGMVHPYLEQDHTIISHDPGRKIHSFDAVITTREFLCAPCPSLSVFAQVHSVLPAPPLCASRVYSPVHSVAQTSASRPSQALGCTSTAPKQSCDQRLPSQPCSYGAGLYRIAEADYCVCVCVCVYFAVTEWYMSRVLF